jgi:hypothetical protein
MHDTPKMDKFTKKSIHLGGVSKAGGGCLIDVPKPTKDMAGIINIDERIEVHGPNMNKGVTSQYNGLSQNMY